jgi:hypothetical protein
MSSTTGLVLHHLEDSRSQRVLWLLVRIYRHQWPYIQIGYTGGVGSAIYPQSELLSKLLLWECLTLLFGRYTSVSRPHWHLLNYSLCIPWENHRLLLMVTLLWLRAV